MYVFRELLVRHLIKALTSIYIKKPTCFVRVLQAWCTLHRFCECSIATACLDDALEQVSNSANRTHDVFVSFGFAQIRTPFFMATMRYNPLGSYHIYLNLIKDVWRFTGSITHATRLTWLCSPWVNVVFATTCVRPYANLVQRRNSVRLTLHAPPHPQGEGHAPINCFPLLLVCRRSIRKLKLTAFTIVTASFLVSTRQGFNVMFFLDADGQFGQRAQAVR